MSAKHIEHTHADRKGTAWCGRKLDQFHWRFLDIDHAANNGMAGGMQVACKRCTDAVIKAITAGQKGAE